MEAVMEREAPDQVSDEATAYEPPLARTGDEIHFYADGIVRHDAPFGKVLKVESRNITVVIYDEYLPHGGKKEHLLHVTDPWLSERPDRRANGAWDFSPAHKERVALKQLIERYGDRLVHMEAYFQAFDKDFKPLQNIPKKSK